MRIVFDPLVALRVAIPWEYLLGRVEHEDQVSGVGANGVEFVAGVDNYDVDRSRTSVKP